ncbi:MAG: permease-like cell division protein FtsX [Candidatus Pacebacteria bacterium]|jgi:cell division transport system permease protein|nr:permease-like cell division protein FtsX [Candidatus Paceibacterota bacterium]MDD3729143.1 permease-like cell division protein FtsX [Candidatus Paceibacterota bacterium]MDD4201205.1 permease-like cell division protein FtsX [Candidatus Paceibacterota bacterium]MDD4466870.1 permease-like cell division protein FtsX [Candidatus Paceibacterota bacterium]MDD4897458.1 permease-like cell division protein FtsX [Candidatus Paceibacterota bacterium]
MKSFLKRAAKSAYNSFIRNLGLNLATMFVMFLVIIIITFLFLLNPVSQVLISNIEEKISVSVYFEEGVKEEEILTIKEETEKAINLKETEYISSEKALERFIERHKDNPVIMGSLAEIGMNPFLASLNIKALQMGQYEEISYFLENAPFSGLINKIDYQERRPVIEKIFSLTSSAKKAGSLTSVILGIIALLIGFGAIKSAIYNSKEEISIMRLVGASNWFIKAPFLIQGAIIGFLSAFLAFTLTFLFSFLFNARIEAFAPGVSMLAIFTSNIGMIILIQFGAGIVLGTVSSFVAVKRYLS